MKLPSLCALASGLLALGGAQAQNAPATSATPAVETAQVVSSTPVVRTVPVQRQVCSTEPGQTAQRCVLQTTQDNLVVAYDVRYTYAGKTYTVQMPYDPGPTLALHVGPAALASVVTPQAQASAPATATSTVVVVTPAPAGPGFWPWLLFWPWALGPGGHPGPRHH